MPKIVVNSDKGLFQQAGTSTSNGTITGQRKAVHPTVLEGKNALHLSASDSGIYCILGGKGVGDPDGNTTEVTGAYNHLTVRLPEMSTANIGWNATFAITGVMEASTEHRIGVLSGTSDTYKLSVAGLDGSEPTLLSAGCTFVLTCSSGSHDGAWANPQLGAGQWHTQTFKITYIAANKALVFGNTIS